MIENGQSPPAEIWKLVEVEGRLWVRLAAVRVGDEWHETQMEITSGTAPPQWEPRAWDYDDAVFRSFETDGPIAAAWLRQSELTCDGLSIGLPTVPDGHTLQWQRRASRQAHGGFVTLEWPMTSYQLAGQPLAIGPGFGALIGSGPSFVCFSDGVASFFGFALVPGGSVDNMAPVFQRQDLSGRIAGVRLEPSEVVVNLQGVALAGATVELASGSPGPSELLGGDDARQTVRLPLPGGLPPGAWVVLKRGSEWLDRKFINYPHTINPDPGVEIAVEPMTEVMAIISGGEGASVEFKSIVPQAGTKLREKVCRTIAAFANGDGGHVLFGVEDDGSVVGIVSDDLRTACDMVTRFVADTVAPRVQFTVTTVPVELAEGRTVVIVLAVHQGSDPPYGVNPADPRYYIRRGATTFPASVDQVRSLARSRPPIQVASPYGSFFGIR